jgi:rhamnulokinase
VDTPLYVAVDLGAGSGRVFLVGLDGKGLLFEEIRRFHYPPREIQGHLRWPFASMLDEIRLGLREAGARARALDRSIASVGVDSWAVDYGLVDGTGLLVEDPICYRDKRTEGTMAQVFAKVPRADLVSRTGIQCLPFNTVYQLSAHVKGGLDPRAQKLLLIPDLVAFNLTRHAAAEYSNATTTQMLNTRTGEWDLALCERLGLPTRLLPEVIAAGTDLGAMTPPVVRDLQLPNVHVVAPATHDTGSAVVGTPLRKGWAYISSGTWSLVGIERESVLMNDEVTRANFTNEGGAYDTIRFLKNVMGMWILESCRKEWQAGGRILPWGELVAAATALRSTPGVIDPDDPRLFNPASMLETIHALLAETGQSTPDTPEAIARVVLDSMAFRYAEVLKEIARLNGDPILGVHIVGGGSLNTHLNQATANASGLPVVAGPVESTVIGNVILQAICRGRFPSLDVAREYVASRLPQTTYTPSPTAAFMGALRRYAEIVANRAPSS